MIGRRFSARSASGVLGAMLLVGALASCTSTDDEGGRSSEPTPARPASVAAVSLSLTLDVGEAKGTDGPYVARVGDTTVADYDDVVRAVSPGGAQKWIFTLPASASPGYGLGVTVDGAVTVLTWTDRSGDNRARAVDTATGRTRWDFRSTFYISVASGTVFATDCPDHGNRCSVTARETSSGAVRWTRPVAGRPYVRLQDDVADHGLLAPSTGSRAILEVYTGGPLSDTSHLEALDVATGRTRPLSVPFSSSSYARVGDVVAYTPFDGKAGNGCTGQVTGVDLRTGRRIWSTSYPVATITSRGSKSGCDNLSPTVPAAGLLAVHPVNGRPVVLDVRTGRAVAGTGTATGTVVARSGGVTFVSHEVSDKYGTTGDRVVRAVRADGTALWSKTFPGRDEDKVALVAGQLVVTSVVPDPAVVIRATTGTIAGRVPGQLVAHGQDWIATWDRQVVRVYDVQG